MTAHLLNIALGPVQEFIAAARRTRDLWFGSFMLSEISNAAAKEVKLKGCTLIFPATVAEDEDANVANVILATVPDGILPKDVADAARKAAEDYWAESAEKTHSEFGGVIREEIWKEQLKGVLEFYAAWVPFTPETYQTQRIRLAKLMAGRKNCRNFEAGPLRLGVPKSSLDGLRETVLVEGDRTTWPRALRIRPGEQLDIVGLVKRTAGGKKGYPSVSRIAADPWLRGVSARGDLTQLVAACRELNRAGLLNGIEHRRFSQSYSNFRYEGTAVYRNRHHEILEGTAEIEERLAPLRKALAEVERAAAKAGLGKEPDPYLAVLVADGDNMGAAISDCETVEKNQDFSAKLATFATEAGKIVMQHHGILVYAGGDDVLAFLPLDTALCCARELHDAFGRIMSSATLSVGVAIGHFYEHLEDLLAYGRDAEKDAKKPDRNGLAVHLHKRGGAPVKVRQHWGTDPDGRLLRYARWFLAGSISGRIPYELHRLADLYDDWPEDTRRDALQKDACRLIDKKRPGGELDQMAEIRAAIGGEGVTTPDGLRLLARELLVARQLAVALRQSGKGETR